MWNKTLFLLVLAIGLAAGSGQASAVPNILVIHSYNPDLSWTSDIHRGITEALAQSSGAYSLSTEYLDAKRYPQQDLLNMQTELIATHVRSNTFNAVIVSDDAAFNFVLQKREELFQGIPVIFCGVNNFQPEMLRGADGITGVSEILSVQETLDAALTLHPKARELVIIGGALSSTDRSNRSRFLRLMPAYSQRLRFHFWQDMPTATLLDRVAGLGPDTIVFLNNVIAGLDGRMLDFGPSVALIRARTKNPIYGLWDFFLGHGIVGGKLVNGVEQGRIAARMTLRILDGEPPSSLPVVKDVANRFFFDHRELDRLGIDEDLLPPDSVIVHRPQSIFEANKKLILAFTSIVLGLLVVIFSLALVVHVRRQTLRELHVARRKAEEANEAKSLFLAHMSHEIRTPLTGIMGLAELAANTPSNSSLQEYLAMIRQSGQSLLHIINDILDFSKVEAGKLVLRKTSFNILKMLHDSIAFFKPGAQEKGVSLSLILDAQLPETVLGDETRIRQIFFNLLGNAVKFTEKGEITLRLASLATAENSNIVAHFEIKDTGCGIPAEKQSCIFERFTQADHFPTRTYQGTGLGLAIVKQLIEVMGGTIHVRSEDGVGSTFFFSIPLERVHLEERAQEADSSAAPAVPSLAVLVVEDNAINQLFLQKSLEKLGHGVKCVANGQEALECLRASSFDCILMDIQMPVMDGTRATQRIRQELGLSLPIIALTAHAMHGDREKFLQQGFDEYLPKPVSISDLTRVILNVALQKQH